MPPSDQHSRPLRSLRVSVTDRCNLRCRYCMPAQDYTWLPHADILTFEEVRTLVRVFIRLGVHRFRLTGGEPLLRRDLPVLVRMLADEPGVDDLALTTNGVLLPQQADMLRRAGLRRVTVSLDTLRPERMRTLTGDNVLPRVLAGLEAARRAGFERLKLNTVVIRGFNDDELFDLLDFAARRDAELRFIEYMDVGGATQWTAAAVVSRAELLERLAARLGKITPRTETMWAPADRFVLPSGRTFGIVSSTTAPFCRTCDRSRLTADGHWYLCLYAAQGLDLRAALRGGATSDELVRVLAAAWSGRTERGAEQRLAERDRGPWVLRPTLAQNGHLEMHTRGG
jgi:cyclic pyranopterin phosphate synthase